MDRNLESFIVDKNDPYFTADKWNKTLNYSLCFENMINKILGEKFKGIYKPFQNYDLYDYVWFNNDYYQITDTKANSTKVINKENYDNAYYYNSNYLALNPNKKIVHIIGEENEYEVSNENFEKFCLFGDEIIALKEQNLYKINVLTKTTTPINYIFSRDIKDIKKDKFQLYILSSNMIEVGNIVNNSLTETKELYSSDLRITDIAINDSKILILKEDNSVSIINKSTGDLEDTFNISQELNHDTVKIVCSDNYSLIVYDGNSKLLTFFNNDGQYIYSGYSENEYIKHGVSTLTCNDNHIVATNNAVFIVYLASRYNLDKANISSLLINNIYVTNKETVEEYLDFSKGEYENENLIPEYTKLDSLNNEGVLINQNSLVYSYDSFSNKTIRLQVELKKEFSGNICNIYIENKKVVVNINASKGTNFIYVDIDKDSYKITNYNDSGKAINSYSYSVLSEIENKIEFISEEEYVLSEMTIYKKIIDLNEKDYFTNNKLIFFNIQASKKSYPFSYVKTDEDGNINLNIQDKSILKNKKGFKVNLSEDTNSTEEDVGLNLKGANKLLNFINETKKTLEDALKNFNSNISGEFEKFKKYVNELIEKTKKELELAKSELKTYVETSVTNLTNKLTESINSLDSKKLDKGSVPSNINDAKDIVDLINKNQTTVSKSYLIRSGSSSSGYYRIYSDGYIEQWGVGYMSGGHASIELPIQMADTNFYVTGSPRVNSTSWRDGFWGGFTGCPASDKKHVNFLTHAYENGHRGTFTGNISWIAKGYIKV